jgi:hypothetical protein
MQNRLIELAIVSSTLQPSRPFGIIQESGSLRPELIDLGAR